MSDPSRRRRRLLTLLVIVALAALTGCWSTRLFVWEVCPGCGTPLRPEPIHVPAE
jgi:hypothetical protein